MNIGTYAAAALAAIMLTATPGLAKNAGHCPPGLAKKAVPCVPPGQAKKGLRMDRETGEYYRIGDYYGHDHDHERIRYPSRFDLPAIGGNEGYYRDGRVVYRVDEDTRRVLELIRLIDLISGGS